MLPTYKEISIENTNHVLRCKITGFNFRKHPKNTEGQSFENQHFAFSHLFILQLKKESIKESIFIKPYIL
jgi:hypothetical protein